MLMPLHLSISLLLVTLGSLPWNNAYSMDFGKLLPAVNLPPIVMQMLGVETLNKRIQQVFSRVKNPECVAHLKAVHEGLKQRQYWALNMMDASAKSADGFGELVTWHFGNYDQCLKILDVKTTSGSFSGKFCMVRVCLTEQQQCVDDRMETAAKGVSLLKDLNNAATKVDDLHDRIKGVLNTTMFRIGTCVPSTCSTTDIAEVMNGILAHLYRHDIHVNVESDECFVLQTTEFTFIDNIAIAVFTFMLALILASTIYDLTQKDHASRNEMYITFSAYSNLKKIMKTSENNDSSNLRCLHGIRFFSISYVILGHTLYTNVTSSLQNIEDLPEFSKNMCSMWIEAGIFAVDTFFLLSGLLLSYIFLNAAADKNFMNFKVFYIHRFVRLTPALAAVLLFEYSLTNKLSDGPYWRYHYRNDCKEGYWWSVLFYVKNWYTQSSCMLHTWYVAADTQLYCLSPILLITLWKKPRLGEKLLFLALFLSWIIPFIEAYTWQCRIPSQLAVAVIRDVTGTGHLYMGTENRCGPWIIGIGLGYILHRVRREKLTIKMNKILVTLMWTYIIGALFMCVKVNHTFMQFDNQYNHFFDSLYNSVCHLFWATGIFFLIFACVTGYGGPINWLLSLQIWVPGSRLTYSIYLIHMIIINLLVGSIRTSTIFTQYEIYRKFFSNLVLSIFAAIILSLMFETPVTAIERVLLKRHSTVRPKTNTKEMSAKEKQLFMIEETKLVILETAEK